MWFWAMFEPTPTWPNFTLGSTFHMQIITKYDFLWARWMILGNVWTDFFVNFSCKLWQNYHIRLPMGYTSDSEQCSNCHQLYLILILFNFSCELRPIRTRYDLIEAIRAILNNVQTDSNLTFSNIKFIRLEK